ncbi:MAG: ribosomal protein S18 acetylase RimI-like enzyme [Parvicellaceae bacterium]|jgi:ribosomal protein S18 acetylase RimI-like enzyme
MGNVNIRKGEKTDMKAVMSLIQELADYEKAPDEVNINADVLIKEAFGEGKIIDTLVAEVDGTVVGAMIYYDVFSTWKGRSMYLEDFVINANYRRMGIGEKLFDQLILEAKKRGSAKIKWQVIDWNEPAIKFYEKLNATLDGVWIDCTLTI